MERSYERELKIGVQKQMNHLTRLHECPCVLCWYLELGESPAEVHHVESIRDDLSDYSGVPLCSLHHRGPAGVHGLQRRGFVARYKLSDVDLLALTIKMFEKRGVLR